MSKVYFVLAFLFLANWVVFIVLAAFYPNVLVNMGLGELASERIPITIIFGFFIPPMVFAVLYGDACLKHKSKKETGK